MVGATVRVVDQDVAAEPIRLNAGPLLSVTVLNYNYGSYLPDCIDSILAQTFRDFELIIIDDCSSDNSLDVVQPYLADPRVRLVAHEANVGYGGSLIEGTEVHSRGEYVTVISADDLVTRPDAFERQIALLRPTQRRRSASRDMSAFCTKPARSSQEQHSYEAAGSSRGRSSCVST